MVDRGAARRVVGAGLVMVLGIALYFAIIGVFGLVISVGSLLFFVALSLAIFRRQQRDGGEP